MNRITVDIRKGKTDSGVILDEVHFIIDGKDLVELLKVFEEPFASREGHPGLAGGYSGLSA